MDFSRGTSASAAGPRAPAGKTDKTSRDAGLQGKKHRRGARLLPVYSSYRGPTQNPRRGARGGKNRRLINDGETRRPRITRARDSRALTRKRCGAPYALLIFPAEGEKEPPVIKSPFAGRDLPGESNYCARGSPLELPWVFFTCGLSARPRCNELGRALDAILKVPVAPPDVIAYDTCALQLC